MSPADRTFAGVAATASLVGAWLGVPIGLTLFPQVFDRIARGSAEAIGLCAGVLTVVHPELPPLGAIALALAAVALSPVVLRAFRLAESTRPSESHARGRMPLRLRRAAVTVGIPDRIVCVDDRLPYAYCAGLAHPNVYVSLGAVRALRPQELEAVLLHEAHQDRKSVV